MTAARAVVLCGGKGMRLRPYTSVLPKPLMPVGDRPILEIVISQLRRAGIDRVTMAVGYLASLIQAYFGDGQRFGVTIDYSMEDKPLGTAGPLSLIARPSSDFLVMNGDVLTDLDYGELLERHRRSGAIATVPVYHKKVEITLGVLDLTEDGRVTGYTEKPTLFYPVSTGIYCFRPEVLDYLRRGEPCDVPDLVVRLIEAGEEVRGVPVEGYWLDIGRHEDYEIAQREWAKGTFGEL